LKGKKEFNKTIRFMGLGTLLATAIGLGAIGGRKLDDVFGLEKPLATACGAFLGLSAGMWTIINNLKKN
tara:strand:+ start:2301 stop:2507 length:207 start_codon:yes stop_codon:yes gene_type:complete